MSALAIGTILLQIGAPILGNLLKQRGGVGGAVAGNAIEALAKELGTEATPQAIEQKWEVDPEGFTQMAQKVEADFAEIAKAASQATISYHRVLEGDRNATDVLTRVWRPVCGLLFPIACMLIVLTVCLAILNSIAIDDAILPLVGLVVPVITVWGGVVGYYTGQRTKEKNAGATIGS